MIAFIIASGLINLILLLWLVYLHRKINYILRAGADLAQALELTLSTTDYRVLRLEEIVATLDDDEFERSLPH